MADGGAVEVAYARADQQVVLTVEGGAGATVEEAIRRSRMLEQFPEIDLAVNRVGAR
ncbi:MAG: RnfH family protein [Xanthomonadaceae bacterium]|nr:RnfH family protein [Xanthomonadaceae bacterium]